MNKSKLVITTIIFLILLSGLIIASFGGVSTEILKEEKPDTQDMTCNKDVDCPACYTCDNGVCKVPELDGDMCLSNEYCEYPDICFQEVKADGSKSCSCQEESCSFNNECKQCYECIWGTCSLPAGKCAKHSDCEPTEFCNMDTCECETYIVKKDGKETFIECETDADCPPCHYCYEGEYLKECALIRDACTNDKHCPYNQYCNSDACKCEGEIATSKKYVEVTDVKTGKESFAVDLKASTCTTDKDCGICKMCYKRNPEDEYGNCVVPSGKCVDDSGCPEGQVCNNTNNICLCEDKKDVEVVQTTVTKTTETSDSKQKKPADEVQALGGEPFFPYAEPEKPEWEGIPYPIIDPPKEEPKKPEEEPKDAFIGNNPLMVIWALMGHVTESIGSTIDSALKALSGETTTASYSAEILFMTPLRDNSVFEVGVEVSNLGSGETEPGTMKVILPDFGKTLATKSITLPKGKDSSVLEVMGTYQNPVGFNPEPGDKISLKVEILDDSGNLVASKTGTVQFTSG